MVYSTLVLAASSASAAGGGLFMLAFGVGTLPSMISAGLCARFISKQGITQRRFNQLAASLLLALALVTLVSALKPPMNHLNHLDHLNHQMPPSGHNHH